MKTDSSNPYRLEDQVGYKLRLANQRHLELFSRMMPDVTPTQFALMAKLHETGPMSQNQLGRMIGLDAATTKGVVDRLKVKELIISKKSETDLRRLILSLTDKGTAFIERAVDTGAEISRATVANLTPREVDRLLSLLDKL